MMHVIIDIPSQHHASSAKSQNNNGNDTSPASTSEEAPENQLTMFVTIMAMLEKAASWLGKLMFAIAIVMLLHAFKNMPQRKDCVFVTFILSFERLRIFFFRLELKLQHHVTCQSFSARANDNSGSGRLFYWIQLVIHFINWYKLVSVLICGVLSAMQLVSQDFSQTEEAQKANWDLKILIFFYVVALAQALMLLAAKVFWEWKVSYCVLFEKVTAECKLDKSDMISIKRFFYDAYSKSMIGSIFDALKMDLVTFAQELIVSSIDGERLMGARILRAFTTHQHLSDPAIRKIGTSTVAIERLIDMLNWKNNPSEEEMRYSAAVIVSKLADKEQNALLVAGIPRAMESISSLLDSNSTPVGHKYNPLDFNLLGLLILTKLAKEHENCMKICNNHDLLDLIIYFTSISRGIDPEAVMRSLQVVKMLVRTTGKTGSVCRRKISMVAFTGINIRDILHHGRSHLQRLALEVLTNLAMDREARIQIGRTGEMVKELVRLFFLPGKTPDQNMLRVEAGEALAMLTLENKDICSEILKDETVRNLEKLTVALRDPVLFVSSSRILHNLCVSVGPEWSRQLSRVLAGFTPVLNAIMVIMEKNKSEGVKLFEVSLGLAAQMLKFITSPSELTEVLRTAFLSEHGLVKRLVRIIAAYRDPTVEAPQIRQFAIELAVEMMRIDKMYVKLFKDAGLARKLSRMTTSELESFNMFSGNELQVSLDSVLDEAFKLLRE